MQNDVTAHLALPLPFHTNTLEEDVQRLRDALSAIDLAIFSSVTTSQMNAAIASLVNGAPGALNTLKELADAINDDANFAASMTTALAGKASLSGATFTGAVSGITAAMVGLGNASNTADANKPVSTAQALADTAVLNAAATDASTKASARRAPLRYSSRAVNTALAAADDGYLIDIAIGGSASFALGFAAAATLGSTWSVIVRNTGTALLVLDPNAAELIDGLATVDLLPGDCRLLHCDGSAFHSVLLVSCQRLTPAIPISMPSGTVAAGQHVSITTAGTAVPITAPAAAFPGQRFRVSVANGRVDNSILWNGLKHENSSETTSVLDDAYGSYEFEYLSAGYGWKVIK